jgi:hypothetical protein
VNDLMVNVKNNRMKVLLDGNVSADAESVCISIAGNDYVISATDNEELKIQKRFRKGGDTSFNVKTERNYEVIIK